MKSAQVALGDVVRIARAGVAPEEIESGTAYVGLEHIDGGGNLIGVKPVDAGELASTKFRFTAQQVLFGKLRPYLKKTARPAFAGICSTDILPLEPTERVDRNYLFHALRRQTFVDEVTSLCTGANLPRISPSVLSKMSIPVPPLVEQKRIAAILDKADALCAKRHKTIDKLDQLLQSVFLDLFGDPVSNPKEWTVATLAEVSREKMANGIFKTKEQYADEGVPVAWVEELFRGYELNLLNSRRIQPTERDVKSYGLLPGDILFCRSSLKLDGIAYNNIYTGEPNAALFECHLIRLRVKESKVDPVFLNFLLRLESVRGQIKRRAKTATMTTIDQKGLGDVEIVLPPITLQAKFRAILGKALEHRQKLLQQHMSANVLFSSIQNRMFSEAV